MNRCTIIMAVLFLAGVLPLNGCATSSAPPREPVEGRVLEQGTNRPIPGAIVIARWRGHMPVFPADGQSVCYHVESATTDEEGRYRFPVFDEEPRHRRIRYKYIQVDAYQPGYEWSGASEGGKVQYLAPFIGGREERLKYLARLSGVVGCYGADNEKPLVPVYKTLYEEARSIATMDKDKELLQFIRRRALYAWSRPPRELTAREIEQAIKNDPYFREHFP
ncbi:Uncharacterized protein (Precursor) [Sulfurifustis variabilis]|uniref:Uncharacterized protein (Precursor) n=1 Tax=Sulfurifustis variabilis TaxID=1675686 RepID=A0A1B4V446_9GAMM|nr:carboxypeptidase-like regulatory domain-containing protein [Sulfurifustis variabilis]BAU48296.1 Uncharacterized protein (Precursor) [Sulfurifustis variabilis]